MGTTLTLLLLAVCGMVLYINLLSEFSLGIQDTPQSKPARDDDDVLPDETYILNDVFNATLGFQKIFAINLPERSDRRDSLSLAAAASNISLEFIDGVHGDTISDTFLPPSPRPIDRSTENGAIGCWASHVKALTEIVTTNLTTALIIEDDLDWDIRLKSQLHAFALSSLALSHHIPAKGDLALSEIPNATLAAAATAPYGTDWDLLHLGHCGLQLSSLPRIIHYADPTVPQLRHLTGWNPNAITPLAIYPHHTRVVTQGLSGVCLFAYAVSQAGARRLLREVGVESYDLVDLAVARFCDGEKRPFGSELGTVGDEGRGGGGNGMVARRGGHVCRGVVPQLFDTWRPAGEMWRDSDIREGMDGEEAAIRGSGASPNVRWSVRRNLERILYGRTDYVDQYPDT